MIGSGLSPEAKAAMDKADKAFEQARVIQSQVPDPAEKPKKPNTINGRGGQGGGTNPETDPLVEAQAKLQSEVQSLAELSPLEYDRVRIEKAKELKVRPGTLDKEVARLRGQIAEAKSEEVVEEISPWDSEVNGRELLNDLVQSINRHVILPQGAATALALWALGSFCMNAWRVWPKTLITSPEKRCGKSTLLEVIEGIVYRALLTSNISPSAIFRCIDEWAPSLLIDEADTFAKDNDELNGVINAGHTKRTAAVIRTEKIGDGFRPVKFSVWAPQVIAGIGEQRGTLHDRSIHIEMRRKLPGESSTKLPPDYFERMQNTRRRCLRWAEDNVDKLRASTLEAPPCGNDRAQDNWTPLFAIAELVGGGWPEKVRGAYAIFTEAVAAGSEDAGHMLIEDITQILDGWPWDAIFSKVLVEKLIDLEDRPWFEWKRGKPLTQNSLAKLLKPYKLTSTSRRIGTDTAKGYDKDKMMAAFTPYLPTAPIQSVVTSQPIQDKGCERFQSVTSNDNVTLSKSRKPLQDVACDASTLQTDTIEPEDENTTNEEEF